MIGLIKKDIWYYLMYFVIVVPGQVVLRIEDGIDPGLAIMAGSFLFLMVFFAVWTNELMESKANAYSFLDILPITSRQIVLGKLILPVIFTVLYTIYALILLSSGPVTETFSILSTSYITVCGFLCLVMVILFYMGIFRFGFTLIFKAIFYILPFVILFAQAFILIKFKRELYALDLVPFVEFISETSRWLIGITGILILSALIMLTIKIKSKKFV